MYQIFISYRREGGSALAFLLKEFLQHAGYRVFFDQESLSVGKFDEALYQIIEDCDTFISVLTPKSLDRCCEDKGDWVRLEIEHALRNDKRIIPVSEEGFEVPPNLPESLNQFCLFNRIDVNYHSFDRFKERMIDLVKANDTAAEEESKKLETILFWGDFNKSISKKITRQLNGQNEYDIQILDEPVELLSRNLNSVKCIILMVTDVTKLTNHKLALKRLNQSIEEYVQDGGKLIGFHDLIYRRTRNDILQEVFGCKIDRFQSCQKVKYIKTDTSKDLGLFADLPDEFFLDDDEICWGTIKPDVEVLFESEDNIPLVFMREYGEGICFWLNSGDYKDDAPASILRADSNLIGMIRGIIDYDWN